MLKKSAALALCGLLLFLTGCAAAAAAGPEGTPYALYFRDTDYDRVQGGDALQTETVYYEGEEPEEPAAVGKWLVESLLSGPERAGLKRIIPAGTALLSLEVQGALAIVDFSTPYSTLSGITLTMADYSVALTLTQIPEIRTVRITVRGQELAYRETQSFSGGDVLFSSTEDLLGTVDAEIYCLDAAGNLTPERRTLELYEGDTQVEAVVEALAEPPENRELKTALPEELQVRAVWLEAHTCYVNLASAALDRLPQDHSVETALDAIARSLCALESVDEVQFLVDGEFTGIYGTASVAAPYRE